MKKSIEKNVQVVTREFEGQKIEFRTNPTAGLSEVRIDEIARFCGWIEIGKSGNECIKWTRVNKYLSELGASTQVSTGDFIPEYIMYALIGKAKNQRATQFMLWVGKVLVEIRTKGGYIAPTATEEQVKALKKDWETKSKFLTEEIHDVTSLRKFIREHDKMKLDECIDKIQGILKPMRHDLKYKLLNIAINELEAIKEEAMKELSFSNTLKIFCIVDNANKGIITLQEIKIGKIETKIRACERQNLEN